MAVDLSTDVVELRRILRDVVALSAIPALWVGREPSAITTELADLAATSLRVDFVFVRLRDPNGNVVVEVGRGNRCSAITNWLNRHVTEGGHLSHEQIILNIDDDKVEGRGIVIPVGVNAEQGLVAAWCNRSDFPSEIDRLLLSMAANSAATVFRMARLLDDHRLAAAALRDSERELRQSRDELEIKVAERTAELRRNEVWLTQAQNLSHTGFWVYTVSRMHYRYWSDESYRIWGFDSLQGLPSRDETWQRIHPEDRDRVWRITQEALHQKIDFSAEFRLLLPDGTIKYLESETHHIFSSHNALVEAINTHLDVTERKHAQEEHVRLRELQSDLARINRLNITGELTASLAHEITQPIASARNNSRAALNFLDKQPPDLGEVREALDCVVDDADRAGKIIDRIRDQIQKAPPQMARFDLNIAIDEVVVLARSAITKSGALVQTSLVDGLLPIEGDRVQLQQVVLNLILNAVEAMGLVRDGPRELSISTERGPVNSALVAVRDSGPGIDPENVERIFEAFYTTKVGGVGMGLSICRSIINAHGGRLWADANEPQGAVFQFILPSAVASS